MPMPVSSTAKWMRHRAGSTRSARTSTSHPARFGELQRVRDEVAEDLAQPQAVADEPVRDVGRPPAAEVEPPLVGRRGEEVEGVLDAGAEVERAPFDLDAARLDLGEVEDVAEEGEEGVARGADGLDALALLLVEGGVGEEVGHADDAVHGRADLVAHHGQELAAGAEAGLGGILRFQKRRRPFGHAVLEPLVGRLEPPPVPLDRLGHRVSGLGDAAELGLLGRREAVGVVAPGDGLEPLDEEGEGGAEEPAQHKLDRGDGAADGEEERQPRRGEQAPQRLPDRDLRNGQLDAADVDAVAVELAGAVDVRRGAHVGVDLGALLVIDAQHRHVVLLAEDVGEAADALGVHLPQRELQEAGEAVGEAVGAGLHLLRPSVDRVSHVRGGLAEDGEADCQGQAQCEVAGYRALLHGVSEGGLRNVAAGVSMGKGKARSKRRRSARRARARAGAR